MFRTQIEIKENNFTDLVIESNEINRDKNISNEKRFELIKLLFLFLVFCGTAGEAVSQNAEFNGSDHLKMDLQFDQEILNIKAIYAFVPQNNPTKIQHFVLNPRAKINSVKLDGLAIFKFVQKEGRPFPYLALEFETPLKIGERMEVEFD